MAEHDGAPILADWPADRGSYLRAHAVMAAVGAVGAPVVLVLLNQPAAWVGTIGAVAAIGVRAWYLASEALAARWVLTPTRLVGPGGQIVPLGALAQVRPFLTDVQLVTRSGDKHLMKYLADPKAVIDTIEAARTAPQGVGA